MAERLVLGVDPGTAILGYGLVGLDDGRPRLVHCGAITTRAEEPHPLRLLHLFNTLGTLIGTYRPGEVAVEQLFFARNVRTALAVGEARGVAVLAAAQAGLGISEYTPQQIKQAVGGYGRATKDQMREMVRLVLGLDYLLSPDDVADAVAVALCHLSWSQHAAAVAAAQPPSGGAPSPAAPPGRGGTARVPRGWRTGQAL